MKSLYSNISSCVMNNGLSSQYFTVGRGVRQGDPLSPYLFILALEVLSCNIREETSIKGITVNGREIKIIQYADDTSCVLADEQSAKYLFKLINSFTEVSGLKLNVNKSQALWLGSDCHCNLKPFNVEWPKTPVKALGVYFSYDVIAAEKVNFESRLKHLKTIMKNWRGRYLTLSGKILLIKTFALSQFVYLASCIHVPCNVVKQIESIVYDFLWNGVKGMVKRSTIIGDVDEGGLKMVDVKSMFKALRVKWTQRYNDLNQAAWKSLLSYFFTPYGGDLIFYCNMNYDQVKELKNIPMFYKDMFNYYFDLIQPDKVKVYS